MNDIQCHKNWAFLHDEQFMWTYINITYITRGKVINNNAVLTFRIEPCMSGSTKRLETQ